MDLTFNLQNSPYFLGALLVLLLLILILRNPTKSFFKFLAKKIKSYKLKIKKKKEKKEKEKEEKKTETLKINEEKSDFVSKEIVKVVKIESSGKKEVRGYWEKTLFLILGIGVIVSTYFKSWDFLASKYEVFYELVLAGTSHRNLTTIIVTFLISIVLLFLIKAIGLLRRKRTKIMKAVHYVLFSTLTVFALVILLESVKILSLINSVIMGIVFVLFGLLIKRKK